MAVYFVYRCDGMGPSDFHRRRFDDATVLDWFRRRRIADTEEAHQYAEQILGVSVYSFGFLFTHAHESEAPPPTTMEGVRAALDALYFNAISWEEHCVQVLNEYDGEEIAYYFFDDVLVRQRPDLTAYLLHDGPLPDGAGEPVWAPADVTLHERDAVLFRKDGEGRIYVVPMIRDGSLLYLELDPDNVDLIDGLRLPELCRRLMTLTTEEAEEWGLTCFRMLRETLLTTDLSEDDHERAFVQTLQAEPDDEATWRAYADWLMDRGGPSPGVRLLRQALPRLKGIYGGDPARNVANVGEHVVQASIPVGGECFDQLILFDDLWAGAHPLLADALIRYGTRWDALSTGNENAD